MQSSQVRPAAGSSKKPASQGAKPKTTGAMVSTSGKGAVGKQVAKLPFDPSYNPIEKRRLPNGEIEYAPKGQTYYFIFKFISRNSNRVKVYVLWGNKNYGFPMNVVHFCCFRFQRN